MDLWFSVTGTVLQLAAIVCAFQIDRSSALGFGIASAGLAIAGGLNFLAAALVGPPAPRRPAGEPARRNEGLV